MNDKLDPTAVKYQLLKERGENIDILLLKLKKNTARPKVYVRSHLKSDGVIAVIDLLEKSGVRVKNIPILKDHNKPNLFKRLALMREHMFRQKPVKYDWQKNHSSVIGKGPGLAYFSFSIEQTKQINAACKKRGINLNSLVLWSVDAIASKRYLSGDQKRVWMIPVNIREESEKSGNQVTVLSVNIFDKDGPKEIYQQIKSMLERGLHWGGRIVANLPKYIGIRALRYLSKNATSPYFGVVTNLGSWNEGSLDEQIILGAPATTFCPIAIALITWNDALEVSCQIHPRLASRLDDTSQFLNDCKNKILAYVEMDEEIIVSALPTDIIEKESIRF